MEEARANHAVKLAKRRLKAVVKTIADATAISYADLIHKIQHEVILKGPYRGMTYGECVIRSHYRNVSGESKLAPAQISSTNVLWEFLHGTGEAGKEKAKQAKENSQKVLIVANVKEQPDPKFLTGEVINGTPEDTSAE